MQLDFPVFVTRGLMKKGIPYTDDTEGAIEVVCETEEQKAGLLKWLMGYQGCTSEESFTPEGDPCTVAFIPNEQPVVILSVKRQEGGPSHFLSLMQNLSGDLCPKNAWTTSGLTWTIPTLSIGRRSLPWSSGRTASPSGRLAGSSILLALSGGGSMDLVDVHVMILESTHDRSYIKVEAQAS